MSFDRPRRFARRAPLPAIVVFVAGMAVSACISVDTYPPPLRSDGGLTDARADVTVPDGSSEACLSCLETHCEPEWASCNDDPDCMACLTDPLGEACARSVNRRPLRNCGCVQPTCVDSCPTLCFFVPPVVTPGVPSRPPDDCIECTGSACGTFVAACIADAVCFACVTDIRNPKCADSQAWSDTTNCLCSTPRKCFEQCCTTAARSP
jgi:hypothetical protein